MPRSHRFPTSPTKKRRWTHSRFRSGRAMTCHGGARSWPARPTRLLKRAWAPVELWRNTRPRSCNSKTWSASTKKRWMTSGQATRSKPRIYIQWYRRSMRSKSRTSSWKIRYRIKTVRWSRWLYGRRRNLMASRRKTMRYLSSRLSRLISLLKRLRSRRRCMLCLIIASKRRLRKSKKS
jgi:hypothetical protein